MTSAVAAQVPGSTAKLLRLLEAATASGGGHRLAEMATVAGLPKSTAHRLAVQLTGEGYLVATGGGSYAIGPRLRAVAASVSASSTAGVEPVLRTLQGAVSGNTVHLAFRSGDHAVYIHKIDGDTPYRMASRVGMRLPLHSSAIGKCILAGLPARERAAVVRSAGLPARTPATITDPERLEAELAVIRHHGYAVDDEENEATIRCVAVPVVGADGGAVGGVSVSTVTFVTPRETLLAFVSDLQAAARALSEVVQ